MRRQKIMNRRFSLDSFEPSLGLLENGGLLGKTKTNRYRRSSEFTNARPSLEEAQLQILEFNQRTLAREQGASEDDNLIPLDGSITHGFRNDNKTFHKTFPDIPEEEDLTHAFTCALQKEVLYHGKMYVSSEHICFYSSVLLRATKVIIEVASVHAVRKKNTAKLLPNALSITTNNGEKYMFVSFRNRDGCFRLLSSVCPHVQTSDEQTSPQTPQATLDQELDTISSHSSQDESLSRRTSVDDPLPLDSTYAHLGKSSLETPRSSPSPRSSISKDGRTTEEEDSGGSRIPAVWEKVKSLLFVREPENIGPLILIYVILLTLLLLSSGYIGLRIVALEEQLSALHSLQGQHKET
ncbi:GRAM domain-containing protein 2A-like [Engraulis encrasicolus]|uniref:GRAM domain-containing protein 2A-like n=1 Tax=Engraulis encrasicolus TaxID=184585 RepID=UPI002FCE9F26